LLAWHGLSILQLYERAGITAVAVEPKLKVMSDMLADLEPDLIRIVGGFRESSLRCER
jgi:hypothetical protein